MVKFSLNVVKGMVLKMKTGMFKILIPTVLGIICILLGIGFSFILTNLPEEEEINYILCKHDVEADDYSLSEEYRVYLAEQDYIEKVKSTSIYVYKTPELFEQYKSQLLLDEAVKYTEKKEENKIILNSETIYYYDEEITPTLFTDYIQSLEDNQFQCNN